MRIHIQVDGAWIKSFTDSAREAYEGLSRAIKMLGGEIEDPDSAKREINRFFIQHGSLDRGALICEWAELTGGDFEETLSEVRDLLERFGSKEQKPSLYTGAEMTRLIFEIKQATDSVRDAIKKHNSNGA